MHQAGVVSPAAQLGKCLEGVGVPWVRISGHALPPAWRGERDPVTGASANFAIGVACEPYSRVHSGTSSGPSYARTELIGISE